MGNSCGSQNPCSSGDKNTILENSLNSRTTLPYDLHSIVKIAIEEAEQVKD